MRGRWCEMRQNMKLASGPLGIIQRKKVPLSRGTQNHVSLAQFKSLELLLKNLIFFYVVND